MVISFELTVAAVAQGTEDVISQDTTEPFVRVLLVKVDPMPEYMPLTFQLYMGLPPLVGVGINVTEVPAQILVAEAAIVTIGVTEVFTDIVTGFETAVGAEIQAADEVITQDTTEPLARVFVVNVGPLV